MRNRLLRTPANIKLVKGRIVKRRLRALVTSPDECSLQLDLRTRTRHVAAGGDFQASDDDLANGVVRVYRISEYMYLEELEDLFSFCLDGLLQDVIDGSRLYYDADKGTQVAELNADAEDAEDEIFDVLDTENLGLDERRAFIEPEKWFAAMPADLADLNRAGLVELALDAVEEALEADRIMDPGRTLEYLEVMQRRSWAQCGLHTLNVWRPRLAHRRFPLE